MSRLLTQLALSLPSKPKPKPKPPPVGIHLPGTAPGLRGRTNFAIGIDEIAWFIDEPSTAGDVEQAWRSLSQDELQRHTDP